MRATTLLLLVVTVVPSSGCKPQRRTTGKSVKAEVTPTSQPTTNHRAEGSIKSSERKQAPPDWVFGFGLGMSRRQVLTAMKPRFTSDRFNTPADQIRASGKFLGKETGARFYFQSGKLARFTLSPQVTGQEIAGRTIDQSAIYRAVEKELGGRGQFRGGSAARKAQFGSATWRRGAVTVIFSLDGGHHDRSGESFVQAQITVQPSGPSRGK